MAPVIIQAPTYDAGPVESVRGADRTKLLRVAGIALVAAVFAFWMGGIMGGRRVYNKTIDDAKQIKTEFDAMQTNLQKIVEELNKSTGRSGGKVDFDLVTTLEGMHLVVPDKNRIFHTNYAYLDDLAVDILFNYYADTVSLYARIDRHIRRTKVEKEALEAAAKTGTGASDKTFGVIFTTEGGFGVANLVEVGVPVCKGGARDCRPKDVEGFKFRTSPAADWSQRKLKGTDGERVVPLQRTDLFNTVTSGNPAAVAMRSYEQRLGEIRILAQGLFQMQKDLGEKLDQAAKRTHIFAL